MSGASVPRRALQAATPSLRGPALFTGVGSAIVFHPAEHGSGFAFRFGGGGDRIPALVAYVIENPDLPHVPRGFPIRNTTLGVPGGACIGTVEHALSALRGLGIADCTIEIEGPEVPIFDGSALPFVEALVPLLVDADTPPTPILLREPVSVCDGDASITAVPIESGCVYSYLLDYGPGSPLPAQTASWTGDSEEYRTLIAPARTFSLEREAAVANALGLFAGFTPRDLLVVGNEGQPIDNAWRFTNEAARHKLLDLIGDVALLGRPLRADIRAERSGHALAHRFCRAVLDAGGE